VTFGCSIYTDGVAGRWVEPFERAPVEADIWTRITGIVPLSGAEDGYSLIVYANHPPAGATFDITEIMETDTGTYFDGSSGSGYRWTGAVNASTSEAFDLTPAWVGAANASASILTGDLLTSGDIHAAITTRSTKWSKSGSYSLRVSPSVIRNVRDTFWQYGAYEVMNGFVAGKTYTAQVISYKPVALSIQFPSINILWFWKDGEGYKAKMPTMYAPIQAGEALIFETFTVPIDATCVMFRLVSNAASGEGDVYWDNLMVTEGVYTGPYRDGSSPGWLWDGTPDASTSFGLG
jgi:hypothetical protein